ncbi:MAG: ERF family protein [Acidobacteria bacterium]|nr:ERF family protein [Acidobacteriota bacterium]
MSAKITGALHQVMKAVGYVQKTGVNKFHNYKYASEADLLAVLRPAMIDAGLMLLPSGKTLSDVDAHGNVHVAIEYTLIHKDGEVWPEKLVAFGAGNDKSVKSGSVGDKGAYKALTGANKYMLFKLFQIETGDDPEEQKAAPQDEGLAKREFLDGCYRYIKDERDARRLLEWWNAKEQKDARADFDLTSDEVTALKERVLTRKTELTPTQAVG